MTDLSRRKFGLMALQDEIEAKRAELADCNATLQQRVSEQLEEIQRIGKLRRFLAPQIADLIVSHGGESSLRAIGPK